MLAGGFRVGDVLYCLGENLVFEDGNTMCMCYGKLRIRNGTGKLYVFALYSSFHAEAGGSHVTVSQRRECLQERIYHVALTISLDVRNPFNNSCVATPTEK